MFDDADTSSISSLIPQVGDEATGSVMQGARSAAWVETVVDSIRVVCIHCCCLMTKIDGTLSNRLGMEATDPASCVIELSLLVDQCVKQHD